MRGDVLEFAPVSGDYIVRVDFFGDEVDQIRRFSVADQAAATASVQEDNAVWPRSLRSTRRRAAASSGE